MQRRKSASYRRKSLLQWQCSSYVAAWALARWKRLGSGTYWEAFGDCLSVVSSAVARKVDQTIVHYRRALETDVEIFDELVDQELELYFAQHDDFLQGAVPQLSRKMLYETAISVGVNLPDVHRYATPEQQKKFRSLKNLYDLGLQRRNSTDGIVDDDLREALLQRLLVSADARRAFARSALDYAELRKVLRRRLERAELVLRSDKADVFMDYDRVRSEGEFRSSVGLPVAALLALCA